MTQPELTLKFTTGRRIRLTPVEVAEVRAMLGIQPLPVSPQPANEPDFSKVQNGPPTKKAR